MTGTVKLLLVQCGVMEAYYGILILVVLSAIVCTVMVTGSWLLGPKKVMSYKSSPYECGVAPEGSARERFPIKFYLVAIVFILFDIEVVFLWSWMTVFKGADRAFQIFSFFEVLIYMATWILGYVYAIRVGAINWDETTSLAEEKLADALPVMDEPVAGTLQPAGGGQ